MLTYKTKGLDLTNIKKKEKRNIVLKGKGLRQQLNKNCKNEIN